MTILTLLQWSLTLVALSASIFALSAVLRSSDRSLSRQLSALSTRCKELEATTEELAAQIKAMRAREHMNAYRRRKADPEPPDPEIPGSNRDWVHIMNEKLALARVGGRK